MTQVTQAVPTASYKVSVSGQHSIAFQELAEAMAYLSQHAESTHLWRLAVVSKNPLDIPAFQMRDGRKSTECRDGRSDRFKTWVADSWFECPRR